MRWLRALRSDDAGKEASAELELALERPDHHTRALVAAADAPETPEHVRAATAMEAWPARRWLALDAARLDAWTWYADAIAPRGGWSVAFGRAHVPTLLVVLASTHRDGFLRERAAAMLGERADPLASAGVAVRAVDHVPQVREVARRALEARRDARDATVIVPILLAAKEREAAAGAFDAYVDGLSEEVLRSLAVSADRETRRFAVERAPFTPPELVEIASSDRDVRVRLAAARKALAQDEAVANDLLGARPATVRARAVSVAADELVRPSLDELLLDRSAHLRRAAQSRAARLGVDTAAVYRSRLPRRTAVAGLGETGSEGDVDRVVALLDADQPAPVRRAAVRALGRLASRDLLLSLLPPLLEGDQPSVAREAGRQLGRFGFTLAGEPLARTLDSPHVWTRQAALGIALRRRGWDTPVAALALFDDEDESLREHARVALGDWLTRKAPSAGAPSPEQAERLRASLARLALAPDLERLVRFHAGL